MTTVTSEERRELREAARKEFVMAEATTLTSGDFRALAMMQTKEPRQQAKVFYGGNDIPLFNGIVNDFLRSIPDDDLVGVDFHDTLGQGGEFQVRALIRYRIWVDKE